MPHQSQQSRRPLRRAAKRAAFVSGLASTAIVATLVPTSGVPADAATAGVLCTKFGPCSRAGMGADGYHAVWNKMFWGMYAGSNCTNYVAYRMIKAGVSSSRPAQLRPGRGNASYWGGSFGSLTNKTPAVGSIAWWNANVPGAGSGGHVAYVEKVYSATDIVVSESNWDGNFDWRRITTTANWPSGFIHLHDAGAPVTPTPTPTPKPTPTPTPTPTPPPASGTAPVSTSPPTISGIVAVGHTLAATPGTWNQGGLTYSYQWYVDGVANPNETGSTIDLAKGRYAKTIAVRVTATSSSGSASRMSATTAPVAPGTVDVTTPPRITGTARINKTVAAVPPVTDKALTSTAVQWYADGTPIPGATTWTLELDASEVAKSLTVQVRGKREAFQDVVADSAPAGPVQAPPLTVTSRSTLVGTAQVGAVLAARPAMTRPASAAVSYVWQRDGVPIAGATAPTYRIGPEDVGHRIAVRIGESAAGYYPRADQLQLATPITIPVKLKVVAKRGHRAATVKVRVKALRQLISKGKVTVKIGKHHATAKVRGRKLVLHLSRLRPGSRKLKVMYAGPKRYQDAKVVQRVRIRR